MNQQRQSIDKSWIDDERRGENMWQMEHQLHKTMRVCKCHINWLDMVEKDISFPKFNANVVLIFIHLCIVCVFYIIESFSIVRHLLTLCWMVSLVGTWKLLFYAYFCFDCSHFIQVEGIVFQSLFFLLIFWGHMSNSSIATSMVKLHVSFSHFWIQSTTSMQNKVSDR